MEGVLPLTTASHPACSSQLDDDSSPLPLDALEDSGLQASSAMLSPACTASAPPPPPPPPPPPLLPTCPFSSRNVQRRSMKKLNWDAIPSQHVLGKLNVWTSKRTQRDLVLDIRSMEELFSHVDKRASLSCSKVVGRKLDSVIPFSQEPQVTVLDSKKSMNVGIFLRHFKRPVREMVQDIHQGNWLKFGTGKLKELCKLLPDRSEVKQLLSFSGNLSMLPEADQFMVQLVKVPGYEERLKMMVLREEFFPLMEEVKNSVAVMTKAANELLDCDDLHSVIRLVLKAGNYMNAVGIFFPRPVSSIQGGFTANAIGFRMTSLLKLADTKANKPGMNLMHYVAKQAEDIDPELLTFPSQIEHIGMASRICKEEIISDFEREIKKTKEVKMYSSRHPGLLQQLETFLLRADAKLADVESSLQELNALSDAVAEYFCEDPATFKLEECCSIFHSFCRRFDTAVLENREREAAELRRQRKESMRIAAKRRSTVSVSGHECEQDSSTLESALHSFLSTVTEGPPRSRRGTLAPIQGSPNTQNEMVEEAKASPCTGPLSPEEEQPQLQKEDEQVSRQEEEAAKMREITRKVLRYQNSRSKLDRDTVSVTPNRPDRPRATVATPSIPRPRSRDFFFANNGDLGSPWTILSPLTCPQRNTLQQTRKGQPKRLLPTSDKDDLEDGVWKSDDAGDPPHAANQDKQTSSTASLPECPSHRAASHGPVLRSVSMDETRKTSPSSFRLGDLFQRSISQRSNSCGSRAESLEGASNTSGFMSFFKLIGSRSKSGDEAEQKFKGSNSLKHFA